MSTPSNYKSSKPSYSSAKPAEAFSPFPARKGGRKVCPFEAANVDDIDYKDLETIRKFTSEQGKLLPRRITGVSTYYQKVLKRAIKRARHMALLPFVAEE